MIAEVTPAVVVASVFMLLVFAIVFSTGRKRK